MVDTHSETAKRTNTPNGYSMCSERIASRVTREALHLLRCFPCLRLEAGSWKLEALLRHVRHQRHVPRPLDGGCETALVLGANATPFPGSNFLVRRDKAAKKLHVFVIQLYDVMDTKKAMALHATRRIRGTALRTLLSSTVMITLGRRHEKMMHDECKTQNEGFPFRHPVRKHPQFCIQHSPFCI